MQRLLSILLILFTFAACKQDPCEGVVCENGGYCWEGECFCPNDYAGENCEITLNEVDSCSSLLDCIQGSYIVIDKNCWPNGNDLYFCFVTATSDSTIMISNFGNTLQPVFADVDGLEITIDLQAIDNQTFQGSGLIDTSIADSFKITFDFLESGYPNCIAKFSRPRNQVTK